MADVSDVSSAFTYTAQIKDGKVTSSISNVDKNTGKIVTDEVSTTAGGELDKEAFLQLLVAQMQYQDPLEPTDNTEYVSQLANFSSLEQMTNMNTSLQNMSMASDLQRASNLVGNYASVEINGQTITGKVDSVEYKDGTAYLLIEGNKYPLSNLKESIDSTYLAASELSKQFNSILSSLPEVKLLTDSYESKIKNLREAYDAMDMYQQSFISEDSLSKLAIYEKRLEELKAEQEAKNQTSAEGSDNTNGVTE